MTEPNRHLALITIVVDDYDRAIAFYCDILGFELVEDTRLSETKRWVVVAPGAQGTQLLLARATDEAQLSRLGDQTGGRVFLFLHTDNFQRDYKTFSEKGVRFREQPRIEPYGTVVVFEDLYGNRWDLIEPAQRG